MMPGLFPAVPRRLASALMLGTALAMLSGPGRAEDAVAQDVSIASGGSEMGGAYAQDLADVLGRRFPARLRIIPLLSGSPSLAVADLCSGKADLAVVPADLAGAAAACPRRKADGKTRGLRLVARLADGAAGGGSWLLVGMEGNRRSVPALEALVALMFPNMDVLAAGPRRQRWSGADAFAVQSGWTRDETAAAWIAGLRERCRSRPAPGGLCAELDGKVGRTGKGEGGS